MQLLADRLQLFKTNHSCALGVENGKNSLDAVLGLCFAHLGTHEVKEFLKADGTANVLESVDEGQDEGIALIETKFLEDFVDFFRIDGAAAVFVENFESGLEFFVVLCCKSVFPGSGGGSGGFNLNLALGSSAHSLKSNQSNHQSIRYNLPFPQIKLNNKLLLQFTP